MKNLLGLYEKALPIDMDWETKLRTVKNLGFDFLEISIDESDEKLARLEWTPEQKQLLRSAMIKTKIPIRSMCFSGHRRYPLGSRSSDMRARALQLMEKTLEFAGEFGIRVIQLAGYDVYYEESGEDTRAFFLAGLQKTVELAARHQVMLAMETMDSPFINSIEKYLVYDRQIQSPWLAVYPDIGNLCAWGNDVERDLEDGYSRIVSIHVKETKRVTDTFPGKFRDVPFGAGDMDFVKMFKKLQSLGYKGPSLMEMWSDKQADPLREIVRPKQFILDKLKEGGY